MNEKDILQAAAFDEAVNCRVIGLSPAVAVGSNMLALAGSAGRDYSNATNQQQLNYIMAMVAAMQTVGEGRPNGCAVATTQAMDLLRQVVATAQAN